MSSPMLARANFIHSRGSTMSENGSLVDKNFGPDKRIRMLTVPRAKLPPTPENDVNFNKLMRNVPPEILAKAKNLVNEAIKNKKIFSINGPYDKIRKALRKRGWVEKVSDGKSLYYLYSKIIKTNTKIDNSPNVGGDTPTKSSATSTTRESVYESNEAIHAIASQLVLNCMADFIWTLRMSQIDFRSIKSHQMINHFRKAGSFTTKSGLIKSFNHLRWFEKDPDEVYPRSYIISDEGEKKAFVHDYQLTSCISLIRLASEIKEFVYDNCEKVIDTNNSRAQFRKVKPVINYVEKEFGEIKHKIDRKYLEMAINYCQMSLKGIRNKDIDQRDIIFCSSKRWEEFFKQFELVTNEGYGMECTEGMMNICNDLCKEFKRYHVQFHLDGFKNIWIVKPGAKSRGRGIYCISKYSEIQNLLASIHDTIIIQKYIEKPLLIYNTKFDIRQWFLVTSWSPLTIWWYKDSYVRFCSQQFTLNDFNESVHLSNNSIQHKYQNGPRSEKLPINNMWYWSQFDAYLKSQGHEDAWKKQILPSMKNAVIDILLCSQEEILDRKNSFEIYGADFMVTDGDFRTWLLEINSSPCMAASTDITAKLTKLMVEDLFKVLFDYPKDVLCETGRFELLFKQSPFSTPLLEMCKDFTVYGNEIKKPAKFANQNRESNPEISSNKAYSHVFDDTSILRGKLKNIINKCSIYQNHPIRNSEHLSITYRKRSQTITPSINRSDRQLNNIEFVNSLNNLNKKTRSQTESMSVTSVNCNSSDVTIINRRKPNLNSMSLDATKSNKMFPAIKTVADKISNDSQISIPKKVYKDYRRKSLAQRSFDENKSLLSKLSSMSNGVDVQKNGIGRFNFQRNILMNITKTI